MKVTNKIPVLRNMIKKRKFEHDSLENEIMNVENQIYLLKDKLSRTQPVKLKKTEREFYLREFNGQLEELKNELKRLKKAQEELRIASFEIPFISKLLKFNFLISKILLPVLIAAVMLRILGIDEVIDKSFGVIPAVYVILFHHQPSDESMRLLLILDYLVTEAIIIACLGYALRIFLRKLPVRMLKIVQGTTFLFLVVTMFIIAWGG